jgi:YD repeat-containing protein
MSQSPLTTVERPIAAGSVVAQMEYDGLGRRVGKTVSNSGDWDAAYRYYWNDWQ